MFEIIRKFKLQLDFWSLQNSTAKKGVAFRNVSSFRDCPPTSLKPSTSTSSPLSAARPHICNTGTLWPSCCAACWGTGENWQDCGHHNAPGGPQQVFRGALQHDCSYHCCGAEIQSVQLHFVVFSGLRSRIALLCCEGAIVRVCVREQRLHGVLVALLAPLALVAPPGNTRPRCPPTVWSWTNNGPKCCGNGDVRARHVASECINRIADDCRRQECRCCEHGAFCSGIRGR